jgi:hypothetical protein
MGEEAPRGGWGGGGWEDPVLSEAHPRLQVHRHSWYAYGHPQALEILGKHVDVGAHDDLPVTARHSGCAAAERQEEGLHSEGRDCDVLHLRPVVGMRGREGMLSTGACTDPHGPNGFNAPTHVAPPDTYVGGLHGALQPVIVLSNSVCARYPATQAPVTRAHNGQQVGWVLAPSRTDRSKRTW